MDKELLAILINQVALPEIIKAIGRLMGRGEPVTEESVRTELALDADALIAKGTAWLDANPKT